MVRRLISLVDDDASLRRSVKNLLDSVGFDVVVFESAEAFLAAGVLDETALLVLDLRLEGMSGLELMTELASTGRATQTVMLTAHGEDFVREQAVALGALALLRKPFRPDELLSLAVRALGDAAPARPCR